MAFEKWKDAPDVGVPYTSGSATASLTFVPYSQALAPLASAPW